MYKYISLWNGTWHKSITGNNSRIQRIINETKREREKNDFIIINVKWLIFTFDTIQPTPFVDFNKVMMISVRFNHISVPVPTSLSHHFFFFWRKRRETAATTTKNPYEPLWLHYFTFWYGKHSMNVPENGESYSCHCGHTMFSSLSLSLLLISLFLSLIFFCTFMYLCDNVELADCICGFVSFHIYIFIFFFFFSLFFISHLFVIHVFG